MNGSVAPLRDALVPAHMDLFDLWLIADSLDGFSRALRGHQTLLRQTDCDGCDNPDGLRVKRVEYSDGSEDWLCSDCRSERSDGP